MFSALYYPHVNMGPDLFKYELQECAPVAPYPV